MTKYPMLDRVSEVREESQIIEGFLNWLLNEQQYAICEDYDDGYYPVARTIRAWLNRYLEIDEEQAETERRALLDEFLRESSE